MYLKIFVVVFHQCFYFFTDLLKYNSYTVTIQQFKVHNSVISVHSQSCTTQLPILEHFHVFKRNPKPISSHPHSFCLQLLAITSLLSISMNLLILDISYKRNYKIYGLLWQDSFTYSISKVHPCCNVCQFLIPLSQWIVFHYMDILHLAYLFINW